MPRALVTGITGQDGSYIAELLLAKGYEVHGLIRRASTFNTKRIDHIYQDPHGSNVRLFLHYGDLHDASQLTSLVYDVQPDEIYHLGAQTHVKVSFEMPDYTGDVTGLGTTKLLEAVRRSGVKSRVYNAASSEMFGDAPPPQNEQSSLRPRSPYAAAKVYGYWMARTYREAYGLFVVNGILFNHESPRRGETFVTRKIARGLAMILAGRQQKLHLGNLKAVRDWGYAPEYVQAMHLMLQQDSPDDYVIGTGEAHTVEEFISEACAYIDRDWHDIVEIDSRYYRPLETEHLVADPQKAGRLLHWRPQVTFRELIAIMMDAELEAIGLQCSGAGKRIVQEKLGSWHQWGAGVTALLQQTEHAVE